MQLTVTEYFLRNGFKSILFWTIFKDHIFLEQHRFIRIWRISGRNQFGRLMSFYNHIYIIKVNMREIGRFQPENLCKLKLLLLIYFVFTFLHGVLRYIFMKVWWFLSKNLKIMIVALTTGIYWYVRIDYFRVTTKLFNYCFFFLFV